MVLLAVTAFQRSIPFLQQILLSDALPIPPLLSFESGGMGKLNRLITATYPCIPRRCLTELVDKSVKKLNFFMVVPPFKS